jgi:chromate transporter
VVGLFLAALYNPVWTVSVTGPYDFALAVVAILLLLIWQTLPWLVVVLSAVGGELIARFST